MSEPVSPSPSMTEREEDFFDALDHDYDSSPSPQEFVDSIETADEGSAPDVHASQSPHVIAHRLDALGPAAAREPSRSPISTTTSNDQGADGKEEGTDNNHDTNNNTPVIQITPDILYSPASPAGPVKHPAPNPAPPARPGDLTSRPNTSLLYRRPSSANRRSKPLRSVLSPRAATRLSPLPGGRPRNGINTTKQGRPARPRTSLLTSRTKRSPLLTSAITEQRRTPSSKVQRSSSVVDLAEMARRRKDSRDGDLFMELADDPAGEAALSPRMPRALSRTSHSDKRRSLQLDLITSPSHTRRSSASGNPFTNRPSSRQNNASPAFELPRPSHQSRASAPYLNDDALSASGQHSRRYSVFPEHSPASPSRLRESIQSPDIGSSGRRRLSFGVQPRPRRSSFVKPQDSHDESTAESSDPKQADSTDVESQTAETVWDELDDLKSRIKKLELSGKVLPNSGATVSGESNDRPRTATTAPTTVDSSPKLDQDIDVDDTRPIQVHPEGTNSTPVPTNTHPMLHAALARAKPLLNSSLYRILEVTSKDALQLASMTSNSSAFLEPSFNNGAHASDRQVRRKADTLCRNLTDLCIALSEGKHEPLTAVPSPMLSNSRANSPSLRHVRNSLGSGVMSTTRPGSRLDARRSSILGIESVSGSHGHDGYPDIPTDHGLTPTHTMTLDRRRFSRDSSLLRAQMFRQDDFSADEDPTLRPPSRALTDVGHFRTPKSSPFVPQRTPSLRETLESRRANEAAFDSNIELLGSEPRRRRAFEHATTPSVVPEEEVDRSDHFSSSLPSHAARRRVTSFGQYQARRSNSDLHGHSGGPGSRRQVFVE